MLPPQGGYMTKIKLLGGVLVMAMLIVGSSVAVAGTRTEQVYAKSAPTATEMPFPDKSVITLRAAMKTATEDAPEPCDNWLVKVLKKAGFRGENLREAWAIVMRESGGREDAISATGDYGMFQFNKVAWGGQDWWNTSLLLTREYNAAIAFQISDGGRTWYPWDIDGKGNHKGNYTSTGVYNKYVKWYNEYPCSV